MAPLLSFLALSLLAVNGVVSHPGHSAAQEAAERAVFMKHNPRSVRSCAATLERRGHLAAALSRRQTLAAKARFQRDLLGKPLVRRDYADYNFSHASELNVGMGSDETLLFSDNSSCVLQPEVTQGPYYVNGELIRSDVHEDQEGVPLYLDIQLVDTSTCEPVPAVFMDLWHCNATGVYSGVVANGNGNSNDSSNIDSTFLRGIQQTDANGVAQFHTIVPGHYTGRAPHIHVLTHNTNTTVVRTNSTLLPGGNSTSAHASHVGQLFFDQALLSAIDQISPYSENTQTLTTNAEDSILASEAADMDPFVEYVQLSDDLADGLLAWITLGVDPQTDSEISPAAVLYETGGVANADSGMPGGGSSGSGSGGPPSGSMGNAPSGGVPTGVPPSSAAAGTPSGSATATA